MSFDQEWAQLKANAQMQLNTVPSGDGSGGSTPGAPDLIVKFDDMGEIGHAAFLLHQHLSAAGKHAQAHTEAAAKNLGSDGFDTGAALSEADKGWEEQLRVLLDACAHISNHLDYSVKSTKQEDHAISVQIEASKIYDYLDVPSASSAPDTPHIPKAEGPIM